MFDSVKSSMKRAYVESETQDIVRGKKSIFKLFEPINYIPTVIEQLVDDKIEQDLNTIKKALKLLEFYRYNGVSEFDIELNNILKIKK